MRPGGETALLADTHAHLDAETFPDMVDVLARARESGVGRILAVGSDLATSRQAVQLAEAHELVWAAVGLHPHEAERFSVEESGLRALLDAPKVVAVGEIGLDYYRDRAPRNAQMVAFLAQLEWARARNLPVSVHNREADDDVLSALQTGTPTAVLHCFSGTQAVAERALDRGAYISFAGNVTYPSAETLRAVARSLPADRILIETDSPVLAPQGWRGRRNEPARLRVTAAALAGVRNIDESDLAVQLARNAHTVFRWGAA